MQRLLIFTVTLTLTPIATAQDWTQWRGSNRDAKVTGFIEPKEWPKELKKKWRVPVGVGEASPLLVGDKLYTFGRQGGDEVAMCIDAKTGETVWKEKYASKAITGPSAKKFPGPRSTPAVGEGKLCTLGVSNVISCLDAANGNVVWRHDDAGKYPKFYSSTSPLIADGLCIVFIKDLIAYDLNTGKAKWRYPSSSAPYGSPVLMTVDGVKQVVTPTGGNSLVGVNIVDGKLLWKVDLGGDNDYFTHYSTPLIDGANVYYSVTGYKQAEGHMIALKIEKNGDAFTAKQLWKKNCSANEYNTPVFKDGLIFGVNHASYFFCVDAKTGEQKWKGKQKHGTYGSILDAGPVLLALDTNSKLISFKASGKGYEEIANYTVSDAETWCVPVIAGNRVFVKDKKGNLTLWMFE